jgi:hypothetical protein
MATTLSPSRVGGTASSEAVTMMVGGFRVELPLYVARGQLLRNCARFLRILLIERPASTT